MGDPPDKRTWFDLLLISLVNATIPAVVIWDVYSGAITRDVARISGVISAVVLNAVLLLAITLRNRRRNRITHVRVIVLSAVLAVVSTATSVVGLHWIREPDAVALAFSNVPLSEIRPEAKRLFVEFIRLRAQQNRDYDGAADVKPVNPAPYSVDSFANHHVMQATSAAVKVIADRDAAHLEQLQKAEKDFSQRMTLIDPGSKYLKLVESWSEGERSVITHLHEWVSSVTDLYAFAYDNSGYMIAHEGKLWIANVAVRTELYQRLQSSEALFRKYIEGAKAEAEAEKRSLVATSLGT